MYVFLIYFFSNNYLKKCKRLYLLRYNRKQTDKHLNKRTGNKRTSIHINGQEIKNRLFLRPITQEEWGRRDRTITVSTVRSWRVPTCTKWALRCWASSVLLPPPFYILLSRVRFIAFRSSMLKHLVRLISVWRSNLKCAHC
ncbi:hypothetical protein Hanom_Chr00s010041g01744421 [Helianthus anomalus]